MEQNKNNPRAIQIIFDHDEVLQVGIQYLSPLFKFTVRMKLLIYPQSGINWRRVCFQVRSNLPVKTATTTPAVQRSRLRKPRFLSTL